MFLIEEIFKISKLSYSTVELIVLEVLIPGNRTAHRVCFIFSDSLNNNVNGKPDLDMDDFSAIGWFGEDDDLLNEIEDILKVGH